MSWQGLLEIKLTHTQRSALRTERFHEILWAGDLTSLWQLCGKGCLKNNEPDLSEQWSLTVIEADFVLGMLRKM